MQPATAVNKDKNEAASTTEEQAANNEGNEVERQIKEKRRKQELKRKKRIKGRKLQVGRNDHICWKSEAA